MVNINIINTNEMQGALDSPHCYRHGSGLEGTDAMRSWGCHQLGWPGDSRRRSLEVGHVPMGVCRDCLAGRPEPGSRFPDKPRFPWKGMDKVRGSGFLGCCPLGAVPRLASLRTWLLLATPGDLFTVTFPDPSVV